MSLFRTLGSLLLVIGTCAAVGCGQSGPSGQAVSGASGKTSEASETTLPKDIYPDTLSRLPLLEREDLDDFGKKVYDSFQEERGRAPSGPTRIRLYSPRVAEAYNRANQYLRYEAGLDPRLVELTILVAAGAMDNEYEWGAHEPAGLEVGLEQEIIDIVKHRKPITGLGEKEAAIIQLGREVLGEHKVNSDTFSRALKLFGEQGLVNVVSLMAHYTATAVLLTTFDQRRPDQKPRP